MARTMSLISRITADLHHPPVTGDRDTQQYGYHDTLPGNLGIVMCLYRCFILVAGYLTQ